MTCKNCGTELTEDSVFCNKCGEKIKSEETTEVSEKNTNLTQIIVFSILGIIFVFSLIFVIGTLIKKDDNNAGSFISDLIYDKATTKDIVVNFQKNTSLFSSDEYTLTLQGNEKIKGLVIEIDFLDKNKRILKTERIEVGNVTPGNEYKFNLNQNGVSVGDLDKTLSFKTRVIEGYIVD